MADRAGQPPAGHGGELTTGRAAVVVAPGRVELRALELPPLAAGAVRVAVEGCGICGSNLPVWEGRPWFEYPLAPGAPGHEAWGVVEAVGDGVDGGCRPGDRVAVLHEQAYADVVDVVADDAVVLPPALDGQPFPGEALGCAFNVAARSRFAPGQTVAVVGIGFLGAVVAALAADAGATVIAVSRRPFSLDVARTMGAKETVALDDRWAVARRVDELTGGAMCDVVVEAVGTQEPLDTATLCLREEGRLVVAGFHQDGQRTVDLGMWNWKGFEIVNAHERDRDVARAGVRAAVDAVASGRIDPSPLYTHRYPLDRLGDGMDAMASRPDGFLKALTTR